MVVTVAMVLGVPILLFILTPVGVPIRAIRRVPHVSQFFETWDSNARSL
jgi:hypothetical protein